MRSRGPGFRRATSRRSFVRNYASPVANETGLDGSYDLSLKYERIDAPGLSKDDQTIFSALNVQWK
jgi:uncharacterized protein DUF3738